jgi:signal transduction histidine kinase
MNPQPPVHSPRRPRGPSAPAEGPRRWLQTALAVSALAAIAIAVAHGASALMGGISWTAAALSACIGTNAARRCSDGAARRAWAHLLWACGLWLGGQLAWNLHVAIGLRGAATVADIGWLAFPAVAAIGTYRLVPLALQERTVARLETLPLVVAAATVVWALIEPDVSASALSLPGQITTVAYAVGYVVLPIVMLQALVGGSVRMPPPPDLMLVLAGLAAEAVGFILWAPELLRESYVPGTGAIDVLWTGGLVAIGAGGALHRRPAEGDADALRMGAVLPGATFLVVLGCLVTVSAADAPLAVRLPLQGGLLAIGCVLMTRSVVLQRQQRELLRKLRHNADELARSNEELEQFAYAASHDLAEPLRSISSFSQFLRAEYGGRLDDQADEYLHHIREGAVRMREQIDGLLEYSRVGRDRPAPEQVSSRAVVEDVVAGLRAATDESGASIEYGALPVVSADRRELARVFQNLLSNAIKFRNGEPPQIRIAAEPSGAGWCFSVADNGVGVEREYAQRIFGLFKRLHDRERYAGTGIGLAIAKRIVERHGGRIWVEPRATGGSVFKFTVTSNAEVCR